MSSEIDLRSDTVTRPTPGMRAAMAQAEVGDDVFGDDPTVIRLEERVANLLGKEAAIYVPSGTMSNQIALHVQMSPGDELLCDLNCHVYQYEAGGPAILSGVTCRTLEGDFGLLDLSQLEDQIRNPDDPHLVRTRMVALENTHNRGGGRIYPVEKIEAISQWARRHGLAMHLDGARLWNAIVATGIPAREWAKHFDTVSVCFSKGLGAPVGSALVGPKAVIAKARRTRKLFGGGMRQAGILAAACIYAMDHHVERLADDHRNAQIIAEAVADTPGLRLEPAEVDTNLIWIRIDPAVGNAKDITARLAQAGILVHAAGAQKIRACTHLDVSKAQAERTADALRRVVAKPIPV
jgi:threonine aldolase